MHTQPDETQPSFLLRIIRDQRVRFLMVGGFNTVLGYVLFVLFNTLIGDRAGRFGYMLALVCSYAVAIFVAFLLHRTFVFKVRGHFWKDLGRFIIVNIFGFGLNALLLPTIVTLTGLHANYAQAAAAMIVAVVSYLGHKHFSFRRKAVQPGDGDA
ncbi:MAG: GtrA family protein [Cellulomonadaceae bacterium]|jgi:putative flippase GtrA|nr:GtrA family protein [Cellulomonadaceae bacterium]